MSMQRPPPQTAFEFAERGWRPSLAWILILLIVVPVALCVAVVLCAIAFGVAKSVLTGQPMPDITGGLDRVLTPMMPYIAGGVSALFALLMSRHREVNTQLGGGQNRVPFDPSSPPPSAPGPSQTQTGPTDNPDGGLVNNQAIS